MKILRILLLLAYLFTSGVPSVGEEYENETSGETEGLPLGVSRSYHDGIGAVKYPPEKERKQSELHPDTKKTLKRIDPPTLECDLLEVDLVIRNNMLQQILVLDNGAHVKYLIYPLVKPVRDLVYRVICFENPTSEPISFKYHVKEGYRAIPGMAIPGSSRTPKEKNLENIILQPGEKTVYYLAIEPDWTPFWVYKAYDHPYIQKSKLYEPEDLSWKHQFVELKNIYYDSRSPEERALIERTAVGGFSLEFLGYELDFDLRGTTEEDFSSPSTFRDEVHLTRLIGEYLKAEETECAGKMQAVLDLVRSFPYPQRILMTYRLAMLDEEKVSERVRQNREAFSPTERARLDRLSRALEELREKTVDEGVTFPETNPWKKEKEMPNW